MDCDLIVVGAGAAGLLAAARAAERGLRTLLLEKNRRPGIKILMSGGTRCNLTHATDRRGIADEFGRAGRFLHSALAALSPQDLVDLFEAEGVATKVEPNTGKVFPLSDRASDVLAALLDRLARSGGILSLDEPLTELETVGNEGFLLVTPTRRLTVRKLLITTGGQSYPGSGTTGDGYRWAAKLGHTIVPPRPALTPITTDAAWVRALQGVTIPDVMLRVIETTDASRTEFIPFPALQPNEFRSTDERNEFRSTKRGRPDVLAQRRGSFLFTHFGLSGPVALDVSRVISGHPQPRGLVLECDFLPRLSEEEVDQYLRHESATAGKKQIGGVMASLLPRRLTDALLELAGASPECKAAELSRERRTRCVAAVKRCRIAVSGTRGFKKAEVTAGGVSLDEVDSRTMKSRLVPGLYFAGEVLDLDGPIGGYNFQAAFSTGWLAAESI